MFAPSPLGGFRSPSSPFRSRVGTPRCRFCTSQGNLFTICGCSPPHNLAHIECLVRTINSSVTSHCGSCGQLYRGVYVHFNRPSCSEWIRRDERAKYDLLVIPLIVLFFYFLAYVGYLHYVTNYWSLNGLLLYLLINMNTFVFVASMMTTFLSILKIFIDLEDWRRRNTDVVAVPTVNDPLFV